MTTGNRSYQELPSGGDPSRRVLNETTAHLSHPRAVALFVRFVRANPRLDADDPALVRVFEAYLAAAALSSADSDIS